MKKVLVTCLILVALGMSCGGGGGESNGDSADIRDTIEGFYSAYNARQYGQCLTYFTDYGDETEALNQLTAVRQLTGEWTLKSIKNIQISGSTATAQVTATIGGETETDPMELKKVGGQWKLVWESTEPPPVINGNGKITYREYYFTCEYVQDGPPETPYELQIDATVENVSQKNVEISSVVFRFYNQAGEMIGDHSIYELYNGNTIAPGWGHGTGFSKYVSEEAVRYEVTVTDSEGKEYAWP